jgi:hypothetical protein
MAQNMQEVVQQGHNATASFHLGGNFFMSKSEGWYTVDIRKWWLPEKETEVKPTKKGIALKIPEWRRLFESIEVIQGHIPEMAQVIPCNIQEDHQNQLGYLRCPECNPNDAIYHSM